MTFSDEQFAALLARVTKLENERVRAQSVTVTAVDPVTSTFSAALPDGQQLAGIASPPNFLPSPDDEVHVDLHGASPVYRPARMTAQDTVALSDLAVAGDPTFMGTAFSDHLAPKSEFQAGSSLGGLTDPALTPAGGGEVGFYESTFEFEPDHVYQISTSNMWVRPNAAGTNRIDVNVKYTVSNDRNVAPPAVSLASPLFMRAPQADANLLGHQIVIQRLYRTPVYLHFRFLITLGSFGGSAYVEMGSGNQTDPVAGNIEPECVQLWVEDKGYHPWTNRAAINSGSGTPAAIKQTVHTYYPNWTRWFLGDGSVGRDNHYAVQGQSVDFPERGNSASQIGDFKLNGSGASIAADLSGATIEKLELWLYAAGWGNGNGGTALLKYHTNTSAGILNNSAGSIAVPNWSASQGRWVDITAWASLFQAGTAKGIQVGPGTDTSSLFYGYFTSNTQSYPPAIRATFTR